MNSSKNRTYISQLPRSCRSRFNSLFEKELKEKKISFLDEDSFFIATMQEERIYCKIKRLFPEAICV